MQGPPSGRTDGAGDAAGPSSPRGAPAGAAANTNTTAAPSPPQNGRGVEQQQVLALALLHAAAAAGDPEAQGALALRYAYGLQRPQSVDATHVLRFEAVRRRPSPPGLLQPPSQRRLPSQLHAAPDPEPPPPTPPAPTPPALSPGAPAAPVQADEAQAVLHYYYAAAAGDPVARMALGYRHQNGLGVPKSCWTAVSYYQPVAEQVADAAAAGSALPHIERIRLHVHASQVRARAGLGAGAGWGAGPLLAGAGLAACRPGGGAHQGTKAQLTPGARCCCPAPPRPSPPPACSAPLPPWCLLRRPPQGLKADRNREVLQYYQYSADHGNVEMQTAMGQVRREAAAAEAPAAAPAAARSLAAHM
jgi:SEL1 protein